MKTLSLKHRCPKTGYYKPLLGCAACRRYPCRELSKAEQDLLERSPFTAPGPGSKLISRRTRMYLYKKTDGSLVAAPADFSPDAPDFDELADVEEVLFVSKIYVKQLRLVVKPKEERDAIRAAMEQEAPFEEPEEAGEEAKPEKKQLRGRSGGRPRDL